MISRVCYSNRAETMRSIDFSPGLDVNAAVDRALTSAAENVEGQFHRVFYPSDDTRFFDWPSQGGSGGGQYADPWRLWLDDNDIVCLTALASGGVVIALNQVFLEPVNNPQKGKPYYTYIELDRSTSATFGNQSQTPQHAISMAGTWGFGADADPAGTLASSIEPSDTTITVSDGSKCGAGDLIILGYGRGAAPFPSAAGYAGAIAPYLGERILVTDTAPVETGLTQAGSGLSTISTADKALATTGSGTLTPGEVILVDQEQMLVEQAAGGAYTVSRKFNGTVLAAHAGAPIYAFRQLSVLRAQLGTTAASYESGAAVVRHRVPPLVRDLSIAESMNQVLQENAGYARLVGSGESEHPAPGISLADKWAEARARNGRKARFRAI